MKDKIVKCGCGSLCPQSEVEKKANEGESGSARLKVLGHGCSKCVSLYANSLDAIKDIGISMDIEKIEDYTAILSYGVMSTPALVFDNKVISYGKVLKKDEIVKLLKRYL